VWYNTVTYSVVAAYVDGSEYKIIVQSNSSSLYYAFFFIVNSSTNISTYRSASYSSQSDAQSAVPGTYTTCYNPWVIATFPSTLVGSWYTASSGGTLKYAVTNGSGISYEGIYYTTIVTYKNGTAYKIIGKSSSNVYNAFHFNNITASTLSGYTYCCNQFQSTAERGTIGTMTVYYKH
jgi:hypothetical protein